MTREQTYVRQCAMADAYRAGKTVRQVARVFGVVSSTVVKALKRVGCMTRPATRRTPDVIGLHRQVWELRTVDGLMIKQIAWRVNLSHPQVYRILRTIREAS